MCDGSMPSKDSLLTAPRISFFSKSPRKDKDADGNKRKASKENKKFPFGPRSKHNTIPNRPHANLKDLALSPSEPVPIFVQKCVQFVEREGLNAEGIYRVPGNQAHVQQLEQRFSEGKAKGRGVYRRVEVEWEWDEGKAKGLGVRGAMERVFEYEIY